MNKFKVGDVVRKKDGTKFGPGGIYTDLVVGCNHDFSVVYLKDSYWQLMKGIEVVEGMMEYEDKWILNEGQDIPDNADCLKKGDSVIAYRLPIRQIQVGDTVRTLGGGETPYKVIGIHHVDVKRRWIIYAFMGDQPRASYSDDLELVE